MSNLVSFNTDPVTAYLAGLPSQTSVNSIEPSLRLIARAIGIADGDYTRIDWATLDASNMRAILATIIRNGKSPNTANLARSVLRGVARQMHVMGLIDDRKIRAIETVRSVHGGRRIAGRDLNDTEKAALMRAADALESPRREMLMAMLGVFMSVGPRAREMTALTVESVDLAAGEITILGKGNYERVVPIGAGARQYLERWLSVRGTLPGALFCAINKAGVIRIGAPMTSKSLREMVKAIGDAAGVDLSPHDFRRTVVGDLLDAGVDISTGMAITGHATPAGFIAYDRRGTKLTRQAVDLVSIP